MRTAALPLSDRGHAVPCPGSPDPPTGSRPEAVWPGASPPSRSRHCTRRTADHSESVPCNCGPCADTPDRGGPSPASFLFMTYRELRHLLIHFIIGVALTPIVAEVRAKAFLIFRR